MHAFGMVCGVANTKLANIGGLAETRKRYGSRRLTIPSLTPPDAR